MKTFLTSLIILVSIGSTFSQWTQQLSPTKRNLYDIKFFENRGVIVGDSVILTSNDSGKTWKSQDFGEIFWRCAFQSKDTIWAVAITDLISKSIDGGKTWETVNLDSSSTFKGYKEAVFFLDKMHGWIGGAEAKSYGNGYILRTDNGGETWQKVAVDTADIYDISFVDTLNGWACSWAGGKIFKTTDGGKSWRLNKKIILNGQTIGDPLRRIFFTTKDSGWTVGGIAGDQIIARTTDGGENWNIYKDINGSSLHGLWFTDSQNGWTVGGANAGPRIIRTTDGGENWVLQENLPVSYFLPYIESIYMFDSNTGFTVADSGIILKTTNGGLLTGGIESSIIPDNIELFQNYPNPFNPSTNISYNLPFGSFVTLRIYDNLGRTLVTLVNNYQNAGLHSLTFDGKDLPSGIYYYKLRASDFSQTKKLILLK